MKFGSSLLLVIALAVMGSTTGSVARVDTRLQKATSQAAQRVISLNSLEVVGAAAPAKKVSVAEAGLLATITKALGPFKLVILFTLWYGFNAGYNVFNAFMKTDFQKPWTSSTAQLLVGTLYVVPQWLAGVRALPKLTTEDMKLLLPIAALNAFGHTSAVIAMFEKGGGSFTHVIKASEPVVSVALNFLINKVVPKPLTALSLLPITYGVAYASTLGKLNFATMSKELTTKAAKLAMFSNVAFSLRSILRRNLPKDFKSRTNLDASNEHAVTTTLSFAIMVPFVLAFESPSSIVSAFSAVANKKALLTNTFVCGMCFYLYNEMQNEVLGSLGPVPTAVGNTLKRVVIFVALYFFTAGETFPLPKVVGCAIAIAGCLGFAIFDSKKL